MFKRVAGISILLAIFFTLGLWASTFTEGRAASDPKASLSNDKIALLKGQDRKEILEKGAKKEGTLTWYTTLIIDGAARPMANAFEKKYPFLKIDYYRASAAGVYQKAKAEYDANRHVVDILDGTASVPAAKEAGMLRPFSSPELKNIQDVFVDPEGYWVAENIYYMPLAYDTGAISAATVPKSYEDLLLPQWKGKIAWSASISGGPQFIGGILKHYGEEKGIQYLKKLAGQNVVNIQESHRAVLDKVIAGEYPLGLNMFHDHILKSMELGAPVKGVPLRPVVNSTANVMGLLKNAPHPYAAMLFIDFFCSDEGQSVMRDAHYTPSSRNVNPERSDLVPQYGNFKIQFLDPISIVKNSKKWQDIYKELFLK